MSGSFLFIVGLANSIILWRIIKRRLAVIFIVHILSSSRSDSLQDKRRAKARLDGDEAGPDQPEHDPRHNHMLMMRVIGPVINFVNKPWKVGIKYLQRKLAVTHLRRCIQSAFFLVSVRLWASIKLIINVITLYRFRHGFVYRSIGCFSPWTSRAGRKSYPCCSYCYPAGKALCQAIQPPV